MPSRFARSITAFANGSTGCAAQYALSDWSNSAPLSRWGKPAEPILGKIDPTVGMKTTPKDKVDSMSPGDFFKYAAEALKVQPPHMTDQPIVALMKRIGFEPGKSFDIEKLDPAVKKGLANAQADAQKLMQAKFSSMGRIVNKWTLNTDTMGVYGNYYLKRAIRPTIPAPTGRRTGCRLRRAPST